MSGPTTSTGYSPAPVHRAARPAPTPAPPRAYETRVQVGDAQDNDYLLNCIIDLGARLTRLEKLFEGEVEAAAKWGGPDDATLGRQKVLHAFADKLREALR